MLRTRLPLALSEPRLTPSCRRRLRPWHANREAAALADRALDGDVSPMRLHEVAHERQPDAEPARGARRSRVELVEPVEDVVDVAGGDARALVGDLDLDPCGLGPQRQGDG